MDPPTDPPILSETGATLPGDVIDDTQSSHSIGACISEVFWMGSDLSTADEWVEIEGFIAGEGREEPLSLSGWTLTSVVSEGEVVIARFGDQVVQEGDRILVSNYDEMHSRLSLLPAIVTTDISLPNTKLLLRLRNAAGNIVDEVDDGIGAPFAGSNASGSGARASMERASCDALGNVSLSWHTATTREGFDQEALHFGTPGYANGPPPNPDILPGSCTGSGNGVPRFEPVIVVTSGMPEGQSVTLNLEARAVSGSLLDARCRWDFGDGFVSHSCNPGPHRLRSLGESKVTLTVTDQCGNTMERSLRTFVMGTKKASLEERKRQCIPRAFSGVVLEEFFPNPLGEEQDGEWIEIANPTEQPIPLCGWKIDDADGGSKPFALDHLQLPPKDRLVFHRRETGIALNNDHDVVRLIAPRPGKGTGVYLSVSYEKAMEGQAYGVNEAGIWVWTPHPTPGMANAFPEEITGSRIRGITIAAAMPNPGGKDEGQEWIEIENRTIGPYWLNGWKIRVGKKDFDLTGVVIPKNERVRMGGNRFKISLRNSDEMLQLLAPHGNVVSALVWNDALEDEEIERFQSPIPRVEAKVRRIMPDGTVSVAIPVPPPRPSKPYTEIRKTFRMVGIYPVEISRNHNYISGLLEGKNIELEFDSTLGIESEEAYIIFDGEDLNLALIEEGKSYLPLENFGRRNEYEAYERLARENQKGLWQEPSMVSFIDASREKAKQEKIVSENGLLIDVVSDLSASETGAVISATPNVPAMMYVSKNRSPFRSFSGTMTTMPYEYVRIYAAVSFDSGSVVRSKVEDFLFIPPAKGDAVIVSEVYPSPLKGEIEWVELKNRTDRVVSIGGYLIDDLENGGSRPKSLQMENRIPPQGFLLLPSSRVKIAWNNGGDMVQLLAPSGQRVESVSYPSIKRGLAYARVDDAWCVTAAPSPGTENYCIAPPSKARSASRRKPSSPSTPKPLRYVLAMQESESGSVSDDVFGQFRAAVSAPSSQASGTSEDGRSLTFFWVSLLVSAMLFWLARKIGP